MRKSLRTGKKSVLFTLDSVLALVIALIVLLSVIFTLRSLTINRWTETNINELSMDYLTILEYDNTLSATVVTEDTTALKTFLNANTKDSICGRIKIYDSTDTLILLETKTGCYNSDELFVTKRSFIANDAYYYAVLEGWYNEK